MKDGESGGNNETRSVPRVADRLDAEDGADKKGCCDVPRKRREEASL